ncbi:hypothetical protein LCGC14_2354690 [marine sediment metagenome]|uniref:Nucleoside 2-deoxyribosyltransferase n=1 Tax=marine sediment metagenome TaxID=412755 RepID=A0A0F9C823_9ZZZZ
MSRTIYLAARYSRRQELAAHIPAIEAAEWEVTSRWLRGDHQVSDDSLSVEGSPAERERFAREDWGDLRIAKVLMAFSEPPRSTASRGGRHVEFGAALAWNLLVIVIGPRENVFHCLPQVRVFDDFEQSLTLLKSLQFTHCGVAVP